MRARELRQLRVLQAKYRRERNQLVLKIKKGQAKARKSGKNIGRPRKWATNSNFRQAIFDVKHDTENNSIRFYARINNVPYYALYYWTKKETEREEV